MSTRRRSVARASEFLVAGSVDFLPRSMVMVRWIFLGISLAVSLTSIPAAAQTTPVGIVTTLQGQATVAHVASSSTLPLKFKDSIFERDRINTAENSIVKVLMGGRAVVTVREILRDGEHGESRPDHRQPRVGQDR